MKDWAYLTTVEEMEQATNSLLKNVCHAFSGSSVYIHHREMNGNARSIRDMTSAQAMSRKKRRRWGLK